MLEKFSISLLLNKNSFKMIFESDKFIVTKHLIFIGDIYIYIYLCVCVFTSSK
jgi:hypothetical protein